jgi:hypothetical protein
VDLVAGPAFLTPGQGQGQPPVPDSYDEWLLTKAMGAGGDPVSRELLRKRGTDGVLADQLRRTLAGTTNPGMKAWVAGALAALDENFDPYAPLPQVRP